MSPATPETILAFDFGEKRTGVALGNTLTRSARPLCSIAEIAGARRIAAAAALIAEWRPERLLVGLPLGNDGAETEMTRRARRFGNQLNGRFGLPVEFVDERYSSAVVEGGFSRADKHEIDAAAAAVILQAWLDETTT